MRVSLGAKILGSFTIIVFFALSIGVGAANRLTRDRYDDFAVQRDIVRARAIAPALGSWARDAVHAVENGRQPETPSFLPMLVMPPMWDADGSRDGDLRNDRAAMERMMNLMMGERRPGMKPGVADNEIFDRILITDTDGRVLLNTSDYDGFRYLPSREHHEGVELTDNRNLVGYLYVGRMIPGGARARDISFFQAAGLRTWLVATLIFVAAVLTSLFLTRHIVSPVKTLNEAAGRVRAGLLDVRIPTKRNDEMGDLTRGFNAMTESLEAADKQRRRLIADSAHELRTPLSLIRTRIEMMEEGVYSLDSGGLAALAKEADRMVELIEELKTLAALESENYDLKAEKIKLRDLISSAIKANEPFVEKSHINVEERLVHGLSEDTLITGDRKKLHRLLSNLLSNALRYADQQVLLVADTMTNGDAEQVLLKIEDDGPGIPEAHRERVFERYYRVDTSRSRASGGTGLGLAICREIVKAHKGDIFVQNSENLGGASIVIVLPAQQEKTPESNT